MNWTKEPPKVEGWYKIKVDGVEGKAKVYIDERGPLFACEEAKNKTWFYGPISKPED